MAGKWFLRVITQTVKPPFPSCICVCMISRGFFGPFFSYRRSRTLFNQLLPWIVHLLHLIFKMLRASSGGRMCLAAVYFLWCEARGLQGFRKERRKTHLGSVLNIFGVLSWHCYNLQTCSSNSQWRVQGSKPQAWTAKMAGAYFYELIK